MQFIVKQRSCVILLSLAKCQLNYLFMFNLLYSYESVLYMG